MKFYLYNLSLFDKQIISELFFDIMFVFVLFFLINKHTMSQAKKWRHY